MNAIRIRRAAGAVAVAAVLPLGLTAWAAGPASAAPAPDQPFGPACASLPQEGEGSAAGMADDPVATAASNNPALSTLASAVQKAGLVDTLNKAENITVFAPTNEAFAKIPKAQLDQVLNDKAALTKILIYHVVGQKITPQQMQDGSFETLEKGTLTTSGSGESYKVNNTANVVCGNVQTANATVYVIDSVLMPKM
ncbi:fasciclin domain-containing protein [Streptomyces sp. NPDC015131]|uniref:fasciclin domain-containing protein n=1 Tax=Streptomyces sp. NPDC015131 TaxID=3364941 RepID=UPI0036F8D03B